MVESQYRRSKKRAALELALIAGAVVFAAMSGTALANRDLRRSGHLPKEK